MKTPIRVRALTDDEREAVEAGLRSPDASVLRRCQIVLASARGQTARQIAAALGCSDQWVRDVVHAFNADGLPSLTPRSRRPHTIHVAFDAAGCERLRELLHCSPRAFGKPTSVWTLALLAEVAAEEGLTRERVSHETIRNTLVRLDIRWQRAKDWITSPDPAYARKKLGWQTQLEESLFEVLQVGSRIATEAELQAPRFVPVVEVATKDAPLREVTRSQRLGTQWCGTRHQQCQHADLPAHHHRG